MKRWLLAGLVLPAICLVLSEVRGDIAGPRRPGPPVGPPVRPIIPPGGGGALPPVKVKLVVKVDEKAKHAILEVPINLAMGQLRDGNLGLAPEADPEGGRRFGLATVVAGLSLTMAFASGGLWLARRGKKRILAALIVGFIFTAGTAAVWSNAAPPRPVGRPRPPGKEGLSTLKLPAGLEIGETLILKPVAPANYLTLIVPKSMVLDREKDGKAKEPTPRDKRTR